MKTLKPIKPISPPLEEPLPQYPILLFLKNLRPMTPPQRPETPTLEIVEDNENLQIYRANFRQKLMPCSG